MIFLRNDTRKVGRQRRVESSTLRHFIAGFCILVLCFGFFTGVWYLTRLPYFTITSIQISGGETISHEEIDTVISQQLNGSYIRLVPNRFIYTYPHDAIVASVNSVPRIRDVVLSRLGKNTLVLKFDEYVPYALWCRAINEPESCYFISADGYAFASAPMLEGGALIRHVIEAKTELKNESIFAEKNLSEIHTFIHQLETELHLRITDVFYTKDNDVIFYINGGGKILVSTKLGYDQSVKNLKSIVLSKEFQHIAPGNFNYIDLRFGNKIFIKEGEDTPTSTIGTQEASTTTGTTTLPD